MSQDKHFTVMLSPAYVWDCENCGRENFQRCISIVLDPNDGDDAEVIRIMHHLDEDEEIPKDLQCTSQTAPQHVTCKHCNSEFAAKDGNWHIPEDEDGEE